MNLKQAIALAIGTIAAIILVMVPRTYTHPNLVSVQTQPNGEIVSTFRSRIIPWQPVTFALVLLITGATVYRLRRQPPTS